MATTTATTVTAVKFADTLDVVGLSPEQIAKFTEKDFAAFTSQQQSELTNSQVKNLTIKQVAALPLKFVEPDTVAGIDPKALSGLALNTLTVDQFSALTPEQIKGVTPVQFGTLTPAQADVLSDMQAASLSSTQLAAFSPKAVAALIPSTVEAIPDVAISGFTPTNIIGLTTDTIKALTTGQASVLTGKQIAMLKVAVVSEMEAEDLAVLTPDALRGFTKRNITGLALDALTPEQFGALTPTQIKLLTVAQLGNLDAEFAPLFSAKVLIAMSANQIAAIPVTIIEALDPLAIKGFSVKNIKGLTTEQLAVLNVEQAAVLTKNQVGSLDSTQVGALNESVITALTPMAFKGFSTTILAQLPAATLAALDESVVSTLTPTQINALGTAQAAALTGSQIQLIKPSAFQSLSDASMAKLGSEAISSLTTAQFGKLSATQLEKFTPVQAASFSSDVKTWLAAKKYALIEGADTVSGGIETSNTIVGSSLAETITAGAGNDIISTGGITGDSIDAGAGNDIITLTASTTLATHTIKGGVGTDTLVFGGVASALTNVSEIENLKLTTAASNQTLALGTGANNSFATIDATVLAAGKTLTLTGSVADVAVSLVAGNLDASNYTAALKVTATTGDNDIRTNSGADSIDAGAGNDTISAGTGLDTIKGGAGADKFVFAAGDSGSPSVGFDTISDFSAADGDVIDFGSTAITIEQATGALTSGTARISATGLATFADSDDTLADKIVAVENGIASGTLVAGESALFLHGTDSYIFISDAVAGVDANDVLIKLAGGGTGGALGITNGDIVSVTGYTTTAFGTAAAGLTASNAVYISDTGANINTALIEASNSSPLLGANNATPAYPNAAIIDGIDATDTDTISMTVGQEQALTAAKLSADDTIHIVDSGANIAAKISELVADVAKIDLLNASDNAVSITYDEALALNAANLTFASDDVVTITGISDSQVSAASALTISDLGGSRLVLTGDGTVSLSQTNATGQNINTQWATSQALTVTADNGGDATISALDKAVLGGSGIKLVASAGASHAVTLTQAQAKAQATGTSWDSAEAITVTVNTSTTTKIAEAATLSATALGGSSVTLDTGATDNISLPASVIATQLTNGANWKNDVNLTITNIGNAGAVSTAQSAYNTSTIGGLSVTLDAGLSITQAALTTALAAGQKFTGTLTVTDITNQATALSGFTTGATGASSIVLTGDASNQTWSMTAAALSTAMTTHKQTFASTETLSVTAATATDASLAAYTSTLTGAGHIVLASTAHNDWSVSKSGLAAAITENVKFAGTETVTVASIADGDRASALSTFTAAATGAGNIVLDSVSTTNAWMVAQASLPASTVKFAADDVVTVTVATESTASALSTSVLGGASILLDGDGSVSITSAEAAAQKANNVTNSTAKTTWKSDDAITVTGIAVSEESTALTDYITANLGGSGVTLDNTDATWSVTSGNLTTALAAGVKFMDNDDLTVTVASGGESAALSGFTPTLTGVGTNGSIVLDSATGTDAWTIAYSALPATTNVTFGTNDVVTVTVPNANEAAAALLSTAANGSVTGETVIGGASIVLNGDNAVSLTAAQATDQIALANTKWNTDDVITVTGIASGSQAAALQNYRKSALGGATLTLETSEATGWTVTEDNLQSALAAAGNTTPATVNTGNNLALHTVGALTDAVTITDIIIANETNALTVYAATLLGAESVVLDAADNSWSVAGATLPTPLAAGIKFASGDTLTVTAIADGSRAAALTDFTSAKTGATNIILDSVSTTNAWSIAGSDLTTALAAGIKLDSTDALTVTAISDETGAVTAFTKGNTGAASVVLDATDNTWSIAFGTLDTALLATNGITFASGDKVTVTGLTTTNAVTQAAALAAYTPTKVGASTIVLDSTGDAWSMTESALAQKASGVTFANSDTLTIVDISQTQESVIVPTGASPVLKYTATNTGASSVILDAADNSWSITAAAATQAIADHVSFRSTTAGTITADTLTVTGSGTEINTLISSHFADLVNLGGTTRTLDLNPAATATLSVAVAHNAMDNSILFAAGDTVEITMTQANDTLDFTDTAGGKVATLGGATKVFVYGGDTAASPSTVTAGGVTFVNGGASAAALDDGDKFLTATMDIITGFTVGTDKIDLTAFGAGAAATGDVTAGAAADLTTTGALMADDTYQIVVGNYDTATGQFTVAATPAANSGTSYGGTLVVWDGNPAAAAIDMVGVVLIGVTTLAAGDLLA
ncbi:MAG: calcium-binding protein [Methylococcales bacterium]|nr:calcium-binding protein [Methylococcales bacterium]